jgi:hypothetical protein
VRSARPVCDSHLGERLAVMEHVLRPRVKACRGVPMGLLSLGPAEVPDRLESLTRDCPRNCQIRRRVPPHALRLRGPWRPSIPLRNHGLVGLRAPNAAFDWG